MVRAINGKRDPLEKNPLVRRQLQSDLASGEFTQQQLADKYGVTQGAISSFKTRHQAVIDEMIRDAGNEYAAQLITRKVNRMEAYTDIFTAALDEGELNTAMKALHSVAEEMGHLPNRVTIESDTTAHITYEIVGVDAGDLT